MPARLKASVRDEPVDAGTLLARIRRRRESIGEIDLREETLREMRDAGRVKSGEGDDSNGAGSKGIFSASKKSGR